MTHKTFSLVAGLIFLLITLGHLSRLVFKWPLLFAGWAVPFWVNGIALLVFAYLAY
jgi:hypothetical protein